MLFQSIEFGILLIVVFFAGWSALKRPLLRKYILIVAGIIFLGYGSKILALFLIVSSLSTWYFGRQISRSFVRTERRNMLFAGLGINLLILLLAKTGSFSGLEKSVSGTAGDPLALASAGGFMTYGVIFFTLQAAGFLIDLYRGDLREEVAFEDVLLLITFFPKLVAGPLVDNAKFIAGMRTSLASERIDASRAFYFILRGLFKKVVLANYLAVRMVDPFFTDPSRFSSFDAFVAVFAFTLQLYWNLSGLFDIGRGVSLLLGFELDQNYERPFTARTFREFHERFNLTLTTWLKRYVAGPLRLRIEGQEWMILVIPAVLGGLWYGTGLNALVIGALAALVLFLEKKFLSSTTSTDHSPVKKAISVVYTVSIVSLILIFLRSGGVSEGFAVIGTMFSFVAGSQADALLLTVVIWGFAIQFIPAEWSSMVTGRLSWLHPLTQAVLIGFSVLLISSLGTGNFPNLVYFAF